MPKNKKAKNAASRKDVFYKRAKEQGYRARSSFKLVHLNNLHHFLDKAKVCIDLCAAPGSWMQVAREYMPTGSVIVGVDLFPIKPIPNTLSIKGDITTESLRAELRSTLKHFKADVVLHDGAPNVGNNWAQDAYDQNVLVLHAFELACEFLNTGGDFITKVFRSKDSASLEYVFKALFAKVDATKPQSSRYESAEIFYVCRHFKLKTGDKADPKFFDPKEVFKELEPTAAAKINIYKPEKVKKKAEGYEDGVTVLYNEVTATEFITCDNFIETLAKASSITFDDDKWLEHPFTTQEIISSCEDIKILNRKDLKMILSWRRRLRKELDQESELTKAAAKEKSVREDPEQEDEEDEVDKVMKQCEELEEEARKEDKKRLKAIRKQKRNLQQSLRMMEMSGANAGEENTDFFNISTVEKVKDLDNLMEQYELLSDDESNTQKKTRFIKFKKGDHEMDDSGKFYREKDDYSDSDTDEEVPEVGDGMFASKSTEKKSEKFNGIEIVPKEAPKKVSFADDGSDSDTDKESETEDEPDSEDEKSHGGQRYTTDLVGDDKMEKKIRQAESWFSQDIFQDVDSDQDEDLDIDAAVEKFKQSGGKIMGDEEVLDKKEEKRTPANEDSASLPPTTETKLSEKEIKREEFKIFKHISQEQIRTLNNLKSRVEELVFPGKIQSLTMKDIRNPSKASESLPDINTVDMSNWGSDLVEQQESRKRLPELDPVGLALAAEMIKTKKTRREFELSGWNRYMKGDEPGLPAWFVEDESNNQMPMNVTVDPEQVKYYKAREMAVNARTIKKVMEARVRKQRRFKKTMNKIIKKTEAMQGSSLMSDYEKQQEIKNMYKKAMKTKEKKKTEYVVMTKKNLGQAPKGIKGKYKMVDPRLKKDVRARMKIAKKKKTMGRGKKK